MLHVSADSLARPLMLMWHFGKRKQKEGLRGRWCCARSGFDTFVFFWGGVQIKSFKININKARQVKKIYIYNSKNVFANGEFCTSLSCHPPLCVIFANISESFHFRKKQRAAPRFANTQNRVNICPTVCTPAINHNSHRKWLCHFATLQSAFLWKGLS